MTNRISWRAPVVALVLAATAVPVELRPLGSAKISFGVGVVDVLANLALYVPVGIVIGGRNLVRASIAAALLSFLIESSQSVMMHRIPSVIDLLTNVLGAVCGGVACRLWRIESPTLSINRSRALLAVALGLALLFAMWMARPPVPSARGLTAPGTLEAHWKFDEPQGSLVIDSSGHGLNGKFRGHPARVSGMLGNAVLLDGKSDWIRFPPSANLRLAGSLTICAWIKSSSYPVDDAAIVSSLRSYGYQLDTTLDEGPRTIGFKLMDACGHLIARYGRTSLALDTWYHVAGVYDAQAKTLDVYLNGRLDNGHLLKDVLGMLRSSRYGVLVGRRISAAGTEFAGAIDDVLIYSVPLTQTQVIAAMRGAAIELPANQMAGAQDSGNTRTAVTGPVASRECLRFSEPEDKAIPAAAGALGLFAAVASLGLRPSSRWLPCLASAVAGFSLYQFATLDLPSFNQWLVPLTSLAVGVSVVASIHRPPNSSDTSPIWKEPA